MGRQKKTVLKSFDYLRCDDFAAYLEAMARAGWHFREWRAGLVFEKGQPEDAVYRVEVFPEGSEFDTRPAVNTYEFAEYCEAAGWKFLDAKRKFCIFKRVRPDAQPILTPQERLDSIVNASRGQILHPVIPYLFCALIQCLSFTGSGFTNRIFSNTLLFGPILWTSFALCALVRCVHFFLWKRQAAKLVEQGGAVAFGRSGNSFSRLNSWYAWLPLGTLVIYGTVCAADGAGWTLAPAALLLIFALVLSYCIARFRPDAQTNQILQLASGFLIPVLVLGLSVCFILAQPQDVQTTADLPLTCEALGMDAGALESSYLDGTSSVFGSALRCRASYEEGYLSCSVYRSDRAWVLDKIWQTEMQRPRNQAGDNVTALWEAETAIYSTSGQYLVRYPEEVLLITVCGPQGEETALTPQQVSVVRAALCESR